MKAKCPYCGRKITYGTRLMEKGEGEHICKYCKKPSNIIHDKKIWMLFTITAIVSLLILIFYITFGTVVQHEYNADGSNAVMVNLFFGKFKTFKWILWEVLPYLVFFFVSPLFVNYQMQKKYSGMTADHIDLDTDFIPPSEDEVSPASGSTRIIPKVGNTKVADDFDFQEISSNSGKISDTRSFSLKGAVTEINPESYVKSASGRSDAPLKKVERVKPQIINEPEELYRVKVLKEQERQKRELHEQAKNIDKTSQDKNYSANRRF